MLRFFLSMFLLLYAKFGFAIVCIAYNKTLLRAHLFDSQNLLLLEFDIPRFYF